MSQEKTNKLSNEKAAEKETARILLIDDDYEDAMILQRRLSNLGQYSVQSEHAEDLSSAMEKLHGDHFDLIFLDNRLGAGMTAKDMIEKLNEHQIDIPVVIITGSGSQHVAVDLMKRGAYDYITKDNITKEKIEKTLFNTLERHNLKMIQQQSEEEIRQQKELLSNIISNIPHFIFWKDKYSVYMGCNDNFAKAAGVESPDDIIGKTDYDLAWKKQEAEHYVATDKKIIKSGQPMLNVEETQLQADGKVVTILTSKVPLKDSAGNVIGILGIYADITERKEKEKALKNAKEEAEKSRDKLEDLNKQLKSSIERANLMAHEAQIANEAKNQFMANMSHEIRTPMNGIIGFTDLLAQEEMTDTQRQYVHLIRQSNETLMSIVDDILDFSKIETGKLDTSITELNLKEMLSEIEVQAQPQIAEKWLEFEIIPCAGLPETIYTDKVRLKQCLTNLINNAVKFTEEGYVHMTVCLYEHEEDDDDATYIQFDVSDSGIGIPPDKTEIIFDSFVQADACSTRKYGGMGLGLAITSQLVHLLGGKLSVTSEEGKGSSFSLIIPTEVDATMEAMLGEASLTDVEHKEDQQTQAFELSGKVLVAEDNLTNQVLTKLLLEKMGLVVTVAQNGTEAVDEASSGNYDLILMDIQMPQMNGYEATKILRSKGITIPVIALTAYAMKGDKEKCLSAGCDDYLAKPVSRSKLEKTVIKYLVAKNAVEN